MVVAIVGNVYFLLVWFLTFLKVTFVKLKKNKTFMKFYNKLRLSRTSKLKKGGKFKRDSEDGLMDKNGETMNSR